MTHSEIVRKLIGKVSPQGEHNGDQEKFKNLVNLCDLVDDLLDDIEDVAARDSHEYSINKAAVHARKFLKFRNIQ